jgi:GT2 family glycosyltransferase
VSELDVVVVAYNSRDGIGELVDDLRGIVDGRVVIVDNGEDGSADVAEAHGATVVRLPSNPGFGSGHNAGLEHATARHVLLLNPDARPHAPGLAAGLAHLAAHPEVAAVQGAVVNESTGLRERSHGVELGPAHLLGRAVGARRLAGLRSIRALARKTFAADHIERSVERPTSVESLAATAPIVRRDALLSVGGFDEGYFLYGEDLDLCRRLRGEGWELVALPDRFAVHQGGASSAGWWEREVEWWRGTMRFAARWWARPAWSAAVAAAALRALVLMAARPRRAAQAWRGLVVEPRRARRLDRPR